MRQFSNVNESAKAAALSEALDQNFYGKRKRDSRLECAEDILSLLSANGLISGEFAAADLVEWLKENKPAKEAKKSAAKEKPSPDTVIAGSETAAKIPQVEGEIFLVTSAQNNTAPNLQAWDAFKDLAEYLEAKILVLPVFYNKNAFSPAVAEKEYFDPAIKDHVIDHTVSLFGDKVTLHGNAAILPTAKMPVNAAAALNNGEGLTIVGSPKQQFKMLPTLQDQDPRAAISTGTITNYNYIRGRAGSEAEADHCFGAWLLYSHNGEVYPINLQFKSGELFGYSQHLDLGLPYDHAAVKVGDLHAEQFDPVCHAETLHYLIDLQPDFVALDDLLHFETRNHHNISNGLHWYKMQDRSVIKDLAIAIAQLFEYCESLPDSQIYLTESNHNSALDSWLNDLKYQPATDPANSKIYYLLNYLVRDGIDNNAGELNALETAIKHCDQVLGELVVDDIPDNLAFGRGNVSTIVNRTEFCLHGHNGANGSRGSAGQFKQWALPLALGHTHTPNLVANCITSGVTGKLDQGYNRLGASSWKQADAIVYPNGAQQLLFKVSGF
jgi:hypothetical protein